MTPQRNDNKSEAAELLHQAREHVSHGASRYYDGVGGYIRREEAAALLAKIDAALSEKKDENNG